MNSQMLAPGTSGLGGKVLGRGEWEGYQELERVNCLQGSWVSVSVILLFQTIQVI